MKAQMIEFGWSTGKRMELVKRINALREKRAGTWFASERVALTKEIDELLFDLGELENELQ